MLLTIRPKRSRLTIKRRLVRNVALAMLVVLVGTSGFVYWRLEYALDRQLNRDLRSYHDVVKQAVRTQTDLPSQTPGQWFQVFNRGGEPTLGSTNPPAKRLLSAPQLATARQGTTVRVDRGTLLPPGGFAFRVKASAVTVPHGRVVVVTAISRKGRDEALRELLLQLALADALVLLAASYVGYRTVGAALDPVERYRVAAKAAGETSGARLPVDANRNDELTRLGHTLNDLIGRIEAGTEREHRYIADAAHELRTPLALLKAEVEVALHQPRDVAYMRDVLVAVAAEVDRMAALSNALLDLEELESGVQESARIVDVHELLLSTVSRQQRAFDREGRHFLVESSALSFRLSEPWIEAALSNLVDNALRYGAGTVTLSADLIDGDLRLAVSDDGPGFPADFQDNAFDRFTRADTTRTTRGSGLGLALVRAVAVAHGGTAYIDPARPNAVIMKIGGR